MDEVGAMKRMKGTPHRAERERDELDLQMCCDRMLRTMHVMAEGHISVGRSRQGRTACHFLVMLSKEPNSPKADNRIRKWHKPNLALEFSSMALSLPPLLLAPFQRNMEDSRGYLFNAVTTCNHIFDNI